VSGEDGKYGLRGIVVDKSAQLIENAMISGFLSGASNFFEAAAMARLYPCTQLSDGTQVQGNMNWKQSAGQLAIAGGSGGATNAMDALSDGLILKCEAFFTVLDNGMLAWGDGRPLDYTFNKFNVGESLIFTITTNDRRKSKRTKASFTIVPYPCETKDDLGHKISVRLVDANTTFFMFSGEGFEPSEKLKINSQSGNEIMTFEEEASAQGSLMSILQPGVIGQKNGIASIEVIGKNTTLKLIYPWGELIPAGSPRDRYYNQ
jgi:hypothetical protein